MAAPKDFRDARTPGQQTGASDLATFGASPAAFAAFAPATFGDGASAAPTAFKVGGAGTDARDSSDVSLPTGGVGHGGGSGDLTTGLNAGAASPTPAAPTSPETPAASHDTPVPPAHADSGGIAIFVPAPQGSGTVAQAVEPSHGDPAQAVASAAPAAVDTPVADVVSMPASFDTVMTSVAALQEAVAALAGTLPTAAPPTAAPPSEATASIGAVIDQITETVGQAHSAVAASVADISQTVIDLTEGVSDSVTSLTDGVEASVASLTNGVATSVAALTDAVAIPAVTDTLGTVSAAVPDIAAVASDIAAPVTAAVGTITDALTDTLGGHDPAGGITTLVGMVSAADAFNLHDMGGGASDVLAPALGSLGAADLLADVVPADALLGIADTHHDGALGGIHLDDGLHGLGL